MQVKKQSTRDLRNKIKAALISEFQDADYREGYTEEFFNAKIATQIKVLREQRGWTQEELASLAEMKQERVAVLENVNYESWTLSVLRRFAKAFDLVVDVEFKEYGEFLSGFEIFGKDVLVKRSFKDDPAFKIFGKSNIAPFPTSYEPATGAVQLRLPFDTESVVHLSQAINEQARQIEQKIGEAEPVVVLKYRATAAGR